MGQGCNSALEDAALLSNALAAAGHDIAAALRAFDATRTRAAHALQHMEVESAWVRQPPRLLRDPLDKTLARVAWLSFFALLPLLRRLPALRRRLHASLFQNIMSTTLPYDRLHAAIRAAPFVWVGLLAGLLWAGKAVAAAALALARGGA
jgi:hypothetical protein